MGIFEGLKAYKREDNSILLFGPEQNGIRMRVGADRICMPAPTIDQFVEAVKLTVWANRHWGGLKSINLVVDTEISRAVPGGVGSIKAIGNYASGKTICTPALRGTILPGVTQEGVIDIARILGFQVEERQISVEELFVADEVFCTANAFGLLPVGSITYQGKSNSYGEGGLKAVSQQLYSALSNIQMGLTEDKMGWTVLLK